jgi:hypothetical protein
VNHVAIVLVGVLSIATVVAALAAADAVMAEDRAILARPDEPGGGAAASRRGPGALQKGGQLGGRPAMSKNAPAGDLIERIDSLVKK